MNSEQGTFDNTRFDELTKQGDFIRVIPKSKDNPQGPSVKLFPTLSIGEIVEIKGVAFFVTRIKADGKLGLKMIPTGDAK